MSSKPGAKIVEEALTKEIDHKAGDDISCVCIYFRTPRKLLEANRSAV